MSMHVFAIICLYKNIYILYTSKKDTFLQMAKALNDGF